MAEIKSTLELAMERTKKIAISEKEREEIKQKELVQKVKSLFHRYREGYLPIHEILKELERMDEKSATTVTGLLVTQWIDALSLSEEEERLIDGIESLKPQGINDARQRFQLLLSQYRSEKERIKQALRTQSTEALEKEGISGSAVEPNVEAGRPWNEEMGKLDHLYDSRLKEIKEQWKAS